MNIMTNFQVHVEYSIHMNSMFLKVISSMMIRRKWYISTVWIIKSWTPAKRRIASSIEWEMLIINNWMSSYRNFGVFDEWLSIRLNLTHLLTLYLIRLYDKNNMAYFRVTKYTLWTFETLDNPDSSKPFRRSFIVILTPTTFLYFFVTSFSGKRYAVA
jgi:hypothetical protein